MYPSALQEIIEFFGDLPESERREALMAYADGVDRWAPAETESYNFSEVRKDAECSDAVGIYLKVNDQGETKLRVRLGPEVQTLTRALTAILCKSLNGQSAETIRALDSDFIPKIVGSQLMRLRSRTVYYVLGRIQEGVASA